jgi:retron-type reverse transcriptase
MVRISSLSEKTLGGKSRRLVDWLNPTGEKKVHSLVDKVYKMKNLELAWEKVKRNRGSGGIDGQSLAEFERDLKGNLERLHDQLRTRSYQPQAVMRRLIPKGGQPGKYRALGIPTVYDRVCQQALMNRLEAIYEPVFEDASFGYRRGRSTQDAMRKIWGELEQGQEW